MKISKATPADFKRITEIHNEAHKPFDLIYSPEEKEAFGDEIETEEYLQETIKTKEILVSKNESNIILGYVVFRKKNDEVVWVSSLFIDPQFQQQGIGEKLLKAVEGYTKENNCKLVSLETHRNADWALNFYKKFGYEIVNEKMTEYPYSKILDRTPAENRPLLAKLIA